MRQRFARLRGILNHHVQKHWHVVAVVLILSLLLLLSPRVWTGNPSTRDWLVAIRMVNEQVIVPLDKHFAEQPCASDLKPYAATFALELNKMRGTVDDQIFLLLREALTATAAELNDYQGVIPCETVDWWRMFRHSYLGKLDFLANVFAINRD